MTAILAAITRGDVADYVGAFFRVWSLLILAYIVLSLIYAFGRLPYSRVLTTIFEFLRDVAEPLLRPFRRILPNFGPFDFSPILALIALGIVGSIVVNIIRG
ncbi:MAG: YggT family protein [Solirubrobacterales bacterium]